jgi:hypothetical protein
MPFHALLRDEISDFIGMDSHSGEGLSNGEMGKGHGFLRRLFAKETFKKNHCFSKLEKQI